MGFDEYDFNSENDERREKIVYELSHLFKKQYVALTNRCNDSIRLALGLCQMLGKKKVLIQDQGGWMTYKDFSKSYGLEVVELKTDYGLINVRDLAKKENEDSVLLINSMPGYICLEPMEDIYGICQKHNILVINDVCGSVGGDDATFGDIIVCSFGRWKPLNAGFGGCIATDRSDYFKFFLQQNRYEPQDEHNFLKILQEKIEFLPDRLIFLSEKRDEVLSQLGNMPIIHKNEPGLNVAVKFDNEEHKQGIIDFCGENNYEYTLCPRYIRVMTDAISIELKRLDIDTKFNYDISDDVEEEADEE